MSLQDHQHYEDINWIFYLSTFSIQGGYDFCHVHEDGDIGKIEMSFVEASTKSWMSFSRILNRIHS